jgi:hypothetical protein
MDGHYRCDFLALVMDWMSCAVHLKFIAPPENMNESIRGF